MWRFFLADKMLQKYEIFFALQKPACKQYVNSFCVITKMLEKKEKFCYPDK